MSEGQCESSFQSGPYSGGTWFPFRAVGMWASAYNCCLDFCGALSNLERMLIYYKYLCLLLKFVQAPSCRPGQAQVSATVTKNKACATALWGI